MGTEMKILFALFFTCSVLPVSAKDQPLPDSKLPQTARYSEQVLLKNWALSRCIGTAFANAEIKQDAFNSASGYLEYGHVPIEAYEEVSKLISVFLARKYSGSIPGTFHTMECLDLFHSKALDGVVQKHVRHAVRAK